jgi:hypothetical protein
VFAFGKVAFLGWRTWRRLSPKQRAALRRHAGGVAIGMRNRAATRIQKPR